MNYFTRRGIGDQYVIDGLLHLLDGFNSENVETLFQNARRQIAIVGVEVTRLILKKS
jgi:hypothetical protein